VTWAELDVDGDGMLSATEAASVPRLGDGFAEADADADGQLTAEEYSDWYDSQKAPGDSDDADDDNDND
jgi:hypothetical protein